jgi:hypothetical protein
MTRARLGLIAAAVVVLAVGGLAAAQSPADVAGLLRVEWEALAEEWTRPRIAGYVHNASTYRIGSVRLRVQVLDAAEQVVREELAWIYVDVPARGRAYFSIRRPAGDRYRLAVESFVLIAREPAGETP